VNGREAARSGERAQHFSNASRLLNQENNATQGMQRQESQGYVNSTYSDPNNKNN